MRTFKLSFLVILGVLLTSFAQVSQAKKTATETATTVTGVNPLTYTDIPDPDIIRVDDTYYMVSTTMYFCPGAPIMKSKDLVHWELVNYVYDYLNDDDVYNLRNGRNAYGKGQWAASLRYQDGMFYCLFIANDQGKTYVYKTKDIENGKWERNVINRSFHDASMLFEDGHLYLVWGNGEIRMIELKPDGSDILPGSQEKLLFECPRQGYGLRAEGSHFYHIGDYYYVLTIDWPSGAPRSAEIWRSKNIWGPYDEHKIVLQGTIGGRGDGCAQGPLVQTQNGDWYTIQFQDHGGVGRLSTIQPVEWVDGWPIMGINTKPVEECVVNLPAQGKDYVWASDEFKYKKNELQLVWQWNHKPDNSLWSVTERKGWLRLKSGYVTDNVMTARNTLTQRCVGPRSTSEVLLDASGMKPGDRAGIVAFQNNYLTIGVEVAEDGTKELVGQIVRPVRRGGYGRQPQAAPQSPVNEIVRVPMTGNKVYLKIRYVFTPQADDTCGPDKAFMSYSFDGKNWTEPEQSLQMSFDLSYFTGYRTGLYNYSTTQTGGWADFDYFRQSVY